MLYVINLTLEGVFPKRAPLWRLPGGVEGGTTCADSNCVLEKLQTKQKNRNGGNKCSCTLANLSHGRERDREREIDGEREREIARDSVNEMAGKKQLELWWQSAATARRTTINIFCKVVKRAVSIRRISQSSLNSLDLCGAFCCLR